MLVGFLGTFLGNFIKASVSRQREFLADASAVRYTRNRSGIAGALKKIGGLAVGSLAAVAPHCSVALSMLAHAGGRSAAAARQAFELGARDLELSSLEFLPASDSGLAQFDAALTELCDLAPLLEEPLLHACAVVVAADGEVNVREAELLRATADSLGCPMPPLLPGQTLL